MGNLIMIGVIVIFSVVLIGWVFSEEYYAQKINLGEAEADKREKAKINRVISSIDSLQQGRMAGRLIIQYKRKYGGGMDLERKLHLKLLSIKLGSAVRPKL